MPALLDELSRSALPARSSQTSRAQTTEHPRNVCLAWSSVERQWGGVGATSGARVSLTLSEDVDAIVAQGSPMPRTCCSASTRNGGPPRSGTSSASFSAACSSESRTSASSRCLMRRCHCDRGRWAAPSTRPRSRRRHHATGDELLCQLGTLSDDTQACGVQAMYAKCVSSPRCFRTILHVRVSSPRSDPLVVWVL